MIDDKDLEMYYKNEWAMTMFLYYYRKPRISIDVDYEGTGYFKYQYGINDLYKYQTKMMNDGYLLKADYSLALSVKKLSEIKTIAEKLGVPKTGKKEDIINRVLSVADVNYIKKNYAL